MSFVGCARIGARVSGANPGNAPILAQIAERLCAEMTPETIREAFSAALRRGKHPSWFEGEIDEREWRSFLLREFERNDWKRDRRLWLVRRAKALEVDAGEDPRFAVVPANDATAGGAR